MLRMLARVQPVWPRYYEAVTKSPPRRPLVEALALFEAEAAALSPRSAVDLGCGGGTDTVELVRRGWRVLAIDAQPEAIALVRERIEDVSRLETRVARIEDAEWPAVDLVNASLSLPFLAPAAFARAWQKIVASLRPGSRFAGHLFGDRDEWASVAGRTHVSRAEAEALLREFDIELFDELERDGQTALGDPKHWHYFEIVARKR